MEHFVVSARKYRPQTFKDVVGQQAITNTLLNAIEHNHLAQALLFTGPRGVGKTTCARILAKMINSDGSEQEDEDFAFNIFELDAASNNSVDDIRNLTDQVRIPPQVGKYKVYIIDEVHMLSQAAFNAFLKTLEEPPKHCIFILATTEKHKIIPTILSRCQIFDFKRITVKDAKNYLKYIAEEQGVNMDIQNFAKGGKTKKVSSYPKKGHILDKFAGLGEGIEPVRETGVFINTDIFTTGGDYILGGFDTKDLDNIEVQGDPTVLSILKVKLLFRSRIEKAVERFKSEIEENFRERVGQKSPTDYEVQNEFDGEIRNLLETYLSLSPSEITDTSVEAVVDLIIENQSSQAWLNTVGERIEKFTSVVVFDGITINKIDQSKVTIDDAEDHTKFASLEQIMEQLHSITEKS